MTHPLYQHSQRPSLPGKDLDKNGGGVLLGDCVGRRGGREQGGGDGGWPIGIEKKMNSTNEMSATTGRPLRADRYLTVLQLSISLLESLHKRLSRLFSIKYLRNVETIINENVSKLTKI